MLAPQEVPVEALKTLAEQLECPSFETSARMGWNIKNYLKNMQCWRIRKQERKTVIEGKMRMKR
jgi:hypothetical protein